MSARLRRLMSDYERIRTEFTGHPYITVEALQGNPPERYRVTYHIKGLRWDTQQNRPVISTTHVAEIYLHNEYPRQKPQCILRTEIWHPNFGNYICTGDHWAAGETLADVIIQIGDMIQYKSYNPKSPLNGLAARWALENKAHLPVGNADLYMPEPEILLVELGPSREAGTAPPAADDMDISLR